jgi:hypothetical protein
MGFSHRICARSSALSCPPPLSGPLPADSAIARDPTRTPSLTAPPPRRARRRRSTSRRRSATRCAPRAAREMEEGGGEGVQLG